MDKLEWSDKYKVGVKKIDDQHFRIFRMINRLIAEPGITTGSVTVSDMLSDMTRYAKEHFETEENLMAEYDYPGLSEQITYHKEFIKQTVSLCTATMLEVETVPETILNYLKNWWTNHILEVDMEYRECFKENGVT